MTITISRPEKQLGDTPSCKQQESIVLWFEGNGTETDFPLPSGWEVYKVFDTGLLMRPGSGEDYTITNNGFYETVVFTTPPDNLVNVGIEVRRDL